MLWTYRFFTQLVHLVSYPYGKRQSDAGNQLWKGRLGLVSRSSPRRIWLHAASVGEVRVTAHLVDYLLEKDPGLTIHITTMTKTGFNTALKLHPSENISVSYFPFDSVRAVRKTFDAVGPEMLVIAETEIWPNLICEADKCEIPIVLVNARMTPKAHGRYRIFRRTMKALLNKYDRFFFKAEDDARRYFGLGLTEDKGVVQGDMKFDAPLLERSEEKMLEVRQKAGIPRDALLFVAGSTRPGEEAVMANISRELSFEFKNLVIVIAPRHIERVDEIKSLLDDKAVDFAMYGDNPENRRVLLVDRLGLLNDLYLAADLSFVGGTLVDIGGHNILEPVWAGCPVLFGPSLSNVREASEYILKHNYGAMVRSQDDMVSLLIKVLSGDIMYATKQTRDLEESPTAVIGDYILENLEMLEHIWKKILRRRRFSLLSIPAFLLWLVSLAYRLGFMLVKKFSSAGVRVNVPVICVGNITVGGTGKTPMVAQLSRYLLEDGHRVGIVSSGYGRAADESVLEPGYKMQELPVTVTGDEIKHLAHLLPEAVFAVDSVKSEAAKRLADSGQVDLIIVDDGFQHFALARDLDIVTYDAGIQKKFLMPFPYGVLREPLPALKRADVIIITRAKFAKDLHRLKEKLKAINKHARHYHAQFTATEIVGSEQTIPVKYLEDKSVFLFAGVGNFGSLRRQVSALCADLDYDMELSDHQVYDDDMLGHIKILADKYDSDVILTTGKDWVKVEHFDFGREIYYLNQTVDLDPGEEKLVAFLQEKLGLEKQAC